MTKTSLSVILVLVFATFSAWAEDWTVNGKTYHNVVTGKVEADRVHFKADDGMGSFMLADLPPDLQKRFNYDPAKAKEAADAQAEHDAQSDVVAAAQAKVDQENLRESDAEAAKQQAAVTQQSRYSSHGGTAPVPVYYAPSPPIEPPPKPPERKLGAFFKASAVITQVTPTGFLGSLSTDRGYIYVCFVKCNTTGMIDGQSWNGNITALGTFSFTDERGGKHTVAQFTDDLKATPLANNPQ